MTSSAALLAAIATTSTHASLRLAVWHCEDRQGESVAGARCSERASERVRDSRRCSFGLRLPPESRSISPPRLESFSDVFGARRARSACVAMAGSLDNGLALLAGLCGCNSGYCTGPSWTRGVKRHARTRLFYCPFVKKNSHFLRNHIFINLIKSIKSTHL